MHVLEESLGRGLRSFEIILFFPESILGLECTSRRFNASSSLGLWHLIIWNALSRAENLRLLEQSVVRL